MQTRRAFLERAAELSALLLASVERAAAIEPAQGSTVLDAEHVVILMQENRSFDHAYGMLRGVRGFNDPRAVTLPGGAPVWKQTGRDGKSYSPFRLNLRGTKATWLGSLPHSWRDQTDARNEGNHDKWLEAKASGRKECAGMPLTMGYYDREDLPFYYALADAFTICDQNFCSSLTGTTPNRLYLWTGTIRDSNGVANVRNSDVTYEATANWKSYPERLEEAGISWRIYQNELSLPTGFDGEADSWLSNFTDNPIEWFDQYNVGFRKTYRDFLERLALTLPAEVEALRAKPAGRERELQRKEWMLKRLPAERAKWSAEAEAKLTPHSRSLHDKAFTTNEGDADYRKLEPMKYRDGDKEREMLAPKGDVLHRFRQDVRTGKLPKVSWIVAPEKFSDHPGAPWYGAWYIAEVMNILTKNPEVWKKTVFILTYDENDGYFDHVPPFVAPDPSRPETGQLSPSLDAKVEYWPLVRDKQKARLSDARGGPVGLGYRVPMVVASPWSRGGYVCSQVFDHTSVLQLLEKICGVKETNISAWRRAVCGDMTSAFRPFRGEVEETLPYPRKEAFLEGVHKAQFAPMPSGWEKGGMPRQEPGTRRSVPLPYELAVEGFVRNGALELKLEARKDRFGAKAAGSGFHAYTPGKYRGGTALRTRAYAVAAGESVRDSWLLDGFEGGQYEVRVAGPNGFLRGFSGNAQDPAIELKSEYRGADFALVAKNNGNSPVTLEVKDLSYGTGIKLFRVAPKSEKSLTLPLARSQRWYDLEVTVAGQKSFARRFAGRVENGDVGISDPAMA